AGALWGAWRARGSPAGLALGIGVAVVFPHGIVAKDWGHVATCGPMLLGAGVLVARPRPGAGAAPPPPLALRAPAVAPSRVVSLAAPWLSGRAVASATSATGVRRAHTWNPLSVDALMEWAAFEDAAGNLARANELYGDAVRLEPQNARTWYALGSFYFEHRLWRLAYDALNNSYTYDRLGLAALPRGLLDHAPQKAFNYLP